LSPWSESGEVAKTVVTFQSPDQNTVGELFVETGLVGRYGAPTRRIGDNAWIYRGFKRSSCLFRYRLEHFLHVFRVLLNPLISGFPLLSCSIGGMNGDVEKGSANVERWVYAEGLLSLLQSSEVLSHLSNRSPDSNNSRINPRVDCRISGCEYGLKNVGDPESVHCIVHNQTIESIAEVALRRSTNRVGFFADDVHSCESHAVSFSNEAAKAGEEKKKGTEGGEDFDR